MYVWYAEPPLLETTLYLLIECNINPNQIDNTGWSALHYAASNPYVSMECLELLGDSAGQVSNDGQTALAMHLRYSNSAINSDKIKFLIRAGSDLLKLSPRFYYEIE